MGVADALFKVAETGSATPAINPLLTLTTYFSSRGLPETHLQKSGKPAKGNIVLSRVK